MGGASLGKRGSTKPEHEGWRRSKRVWPNWLFSLFSEPEREREREMRPGERKKGLGGLLERRRKLDTSHMPQLEEEYKKKKRREKNAS